MLVFVYNLFAMNIYLNKGIVISKAKITNDLSDFSQISDNIQIEAVFGSSFGKIVIPKSDIVYIEPEDNSLIIPQILDKSGIIDINSLFFKNIPSHSFSKLPPYTYLRTEVNGYVLFGFNGLKSFIIYPQTELFFDFHVSHNEKDYSVSEEYLIYLNTGIIIGCDFNRKFNYNYKIYLTEDIHLVINSSVFYIESFINHFTIAVLDGNITFVETNETQKIISANQIADIYLDKKEFLIVQHISSSPEIHDILKNIENEEFFIEK